MHAAWAAGWYIGLDTVQAQIAFERTWFLIYDLIAGVLCAFAGFTALAMIRAECRFLSLKILRRIAMAGTFILLVRDIGGMIKIIVLWIADRSIVELSVFWDLWFCVGAMLFGAATWRFYHIVRISQANV